MKFTTTSKYKKLVYWAKENKKLLIISSLILFSIIALVFFIRLRSNSSDELKREVANTPIAKPKEFFYSPLTGTEVKDMAATKQAVTGIMIENSPDARPQSGLKNSGVVFETIAESTITRFLVLYQEQKPQLIGPVRSVRPYYIDWVAAFDASVAHIGGSKMALDEVRNGNYKDIDQFFNSSAYWRAKDRYAPHNVYTSFEKIDELNSKKGYTSSSFSGFKRKDSTKSETPSATKISVSMGDLVYDSSYVYNSETNLYSRSVGGKPHLDREEGQISPRVVIVMKAVMSQVFEDGWRENIQTIGKGDVYIFQDGLVVKGTWSKASKKDQIKFTDSENNEIGLARGQTWLTIIPVQSGDVSWQ